ncbi:DNA-protecting protein DprA, partial [Burkholderia multivorans]
MRDVTPQRIAVAALLRIGEPGDGLLKALVDAAGPVTAVELIRAISSGAVAVDEVVGRLSAEPGDITG